MKMTADELVAKVKARLQVEDDERRSLDYADDTYRDQQLVDWDTARPPTPPEVAARNLMRSRYRHAKMLARDGNLEPLRKILTELTDDPDIANFIAAPPGPPRRRNYVRKNPPNPFYGRRERREERQQQVKTLWRIRKIVQQEIGTRYTRNTVVAIAAKVIKRSMREVREMMTRGR
jgi:hypothetical protein